MTTTHKCREPIQQPRIGVFTTDPVNESSAIALAAKCGGVAIASHDLDSLQRADVDCLIIDCDHLKLLGDPAALAVPGAARLQIAVSYHFDRVTVKSLRGMGVIACRRFRASIRLAIRLLARTPVKNAA